MDDWHRKLARDLVAETPAGGMPEGAAALEIAFGGARSAVAYALELARAHRLPVSGSVVGDDVWMRFGDGRARFTLDRRQAQVEIDITLPGPTGPGGQAPPRQRKRQVRWADPQRALLDTDGTPVDLGALARTSIEDLIADWRSRPAIEKGLSSAPPPDLDDGTPTAS
jgi:hypothetical protein